jgi:hypothetical protein
MKRSDNELRNLFYGDYLICNACNQIVFRAPSQPPGRVSFREISSSYFSHLKNCFALKRLIVNTRHGKAENRNKTPTRVSV